MNYGKIIYYDTANAKGLSTVLFVSGCDNHCVGCHNQQTWDFNYGKEYTEETEKRILKSLENPHIKNLVISGGEPLHDNNRKIVSDLCRKAKFEYNKTVILYTGYKINIAYIDSKIGDGYQEVYLNQYNKSIKLNVNPFDYIIDGKYINNMRVSGIDYRGSTNQKCYKITTFSNGLFFIDDVTNNYFKSEV